jgi:hypothetical protein
MCGHAMRWSRWSYLAAVLLLLVGCGGDPGGTAEPDSDDAAVEEPDSDDRPATEEGTTEEATPEDDAAEGVTTEEGTDAEDDLALEDGRHPAFLTGLDVSGRTVTFDLIQFLTGDEAVAAYLEDTGEPGGPPNDYHIRNVNPRLRTLPISDAVTVTVVRLGEPTGAGSVPWTLAELPAHLAETSPTEDLGRLSWNPYWLTVADGEVVAIDEQYLP